MTAIPKPIVCEDGTVIRLKREKYQPKAEYGLKSTDYRQWSKGVKKTYRGPWRHRSERTHWETKSWDRLFAYPLIDATAHRLGMTFEEVRRVIEAYGDECWESLMVGKAVGCFGGFVLALRKTEAHHASPLPRYAGSPRVVRAFRPSVHLNPHLKCDAEVFFRPRHRVSTQAVLMRQRYTHRWKKGQFTRNEDYGKPGADPRKYIPTRELNDPALRQAAAARRGHAQP